MAVTATHRHVHIPWIPIIAALIAVAVAVTLIALLNNEPVTTTSESATTSVQVLGVPGVAVVPKPEPLAFRNYDAIPTTPPLARALDYTRNQIPRAVLHEPYTAPVVDPFPFNHFMGEP